MCAFAGWLGWLARIAGLAEIEGSKFSKWCRFRWLTYWIRENPVLEWNRAVPLCWLTRRNRRNLRNCVNRRLKIFKGVSLLVVDLLNLRKSSPRMKYGCALLVVDWMTCRNRGNRRPFYFAAKNLYEITKIFSLAYLLKMVPQHGYVHSKSLSRKNIQWHYHLN